MLVFGYPPILECSSKGDKRFSAFYARLKSYNYQSIEELYQASKIFEGGITNLSWREAKGKKAINQEQLKDIYHELWVQYFKENLNLYNVIKQYNGFSDIYGQPNHNCQAESIYKIRMELEEHV